MGMWVLLGNKRAFDPLLTFEIYTRLVEVSNHAGNMTRGKTVGAFPQMCRRSATPPLETGRVVSNRVVEIDRSISGTRASNLSLLVWSEHPNFASKGLWDLPTSENSLKRTVWNHPFALAAEWRTKRGSGSVSVGRNASRFGSRRCLRPASLA